MIHKILIEELLELQGLIITNIEENKKKRASLR